MSASVSVFNRQRAAKIKTGVLRRIIARLLEQELARQAFEISVFLVGEKRIAVAHWGILNEKVVDRCRDAGNVISHVIFKNS